MSASKKVTTLNIVQDIATPHNNVIIAALKARKDVDLHLWYCQDDPAKYGWKTNITHSVQQANIYHATRIDWTFIRHVLKNPQQKWFIVGWMNPTTRLLIPLLWALRRPYNLWFDLPQDELARNPIKKTVREAMYFFARTSNTHIFCVGQMVVEYFKKRGFPTSRLTNLPIFVDVVPNTEVFTAKKSALFKKYGVKTGDFLISAGSRLVHAKGFDILIKAIHLLPKSDRDRVKCVIVGKGEERENLGKLVEEHTLQNHVIFEDWMEYADFQSLMANSHVFVHPARFDAYGGAIYAMPLGTPVIGSTGAGAAVDRVVEGINGFFFDPEKPKELSRILSNCIAQPDKLERMGRNARKTAEKWLPHTGAEILLNNLQK